MRNQSTKSQLKTLMKKVMAAATANDTVTAEEQLRMAASAIQKAGRKRVLHPNTASRRVARLARVVHRSKNIAASSA